MREKKIVKEIESVESEWVRKRERASFLAMRSSFALPYAAVFLSSLFKHRVFIAKLSAQILPVSDDQPYLIVE